MWGSCPGLAPPSRELTRFFLLSVDGGLEDAREKVRMSPSITNSAQFPVQRRIREIIRRVCRENGVDIISGVVSADHVHMFVSIPPKLSISDFMRKVKGRSSFLIQREFPALKKRYWGQRFWGRGYFSTTNRAITEDVVLQYLEKHVVDPTGASR